MRKSIFMAGVIFWSYALYADTKSISRSTYDHVLDIAESIYGPEVRSLGQTLQIHRIWNDERVNAVVYKIASDWSIFFFGGMARHSLISLDSFALVACHEFGHLFAAAPLDKIAGEGAADYFATEQCLPRFWEKLPSGQGLSGEVDLPASVQGACAEAYDEASAAADCRRTIAAAYAQASLYASLVNQPQPTFETPDRTQVGATRTDYPSAQCRLDTFVAGALKAPRPRCWFKPI